MRNTIVALLIAMGFAAHAAAQCCGDCDGSGEVTINELIIAVNNALNGCGGATPTEGPPPTSTRRPTATPTPEGRCPFTFAAGAGGLCSFSGHFNRGCGAELSSVFASDGSTVVVTIATMLDDPPAVFFAAQVNSDTTASLNAWSSDNFQTSHPTAGNLQLTGGGSQLVIFPNDPPFMILGCNFVQYQGAFVGHTGGSSVSAAADGNADFDAARERLQAWLARRVPELARP